MLEECSEPLFCFTSDLDWAPESMTEEFIRFFNEENLPLTPFVTHHSETIKRNYRKDKLGYVGIHPNFAFDTTHGKDIDDVITNTSKFWPEARCFRSHYYVDSLFITQKLHSIGFKYDSNSCLFLQPDILPQNLVTGLLRFPVFFEDIIYADKTSPFRLPYIADKMMTGGLKIFNFHPIHFCINTPSVKYYATHRDELYSQENWRSLTYDGDGLKTFLMEIVDFVKDHGFRTFYLEDLYHIFAPYHDKNGVSPLLLKNVTTEKPVTNVSVWRESELLEKYPQLTPEERSDLLKSIYDKTDGRRLYATSPDYNLRDLENSFIIETIQILSRNEREKIIDVGCGNGLTALRLAQSVSSGIVGVDFSTAMIDGAKYLTEQFERLKTCPTFKVGDARKLEYPDNFFDVAITQRLLLNLPDNETQKAVIMEIHRVLKSGGLFVMVEGTRDGLRRLNDFRTKFGLDAIPDKSKTNVSSLKFEEEEIDAFLKKRFEIVKKQHFGMYYLISRIVHPLLVAPNRPRYDAKINEIARKVAEQDLDYKQMSHVVGYVLKVIK